MHKVLIQRYSLLSLVVGLLVGSPLAAQAVSKPSPPATTLAAARFQANTEPVYGLLGKLGKAQNYVVENYLLTNDNQIYIVVGETPAIEQQIVTLRDQQATVKVWGTLYPQGRLTATPEIIVTQLSVADDTAAATPPPSAQPQATVRNDAINLRGGPDIGYPILGSLQQGQTCDITGRNAANNWWQLKCPPNLQGWVLAQLVDTTGNTSTVAVITVAPPPPAAAPTPAPTYYGWKMSFWHNRALAGQPATVSDVPEVNLDWGSGPPERPDLFSTRFERMINFNPGSYRFVARADDGVRVFIDNQLIIDQWHTSAGAVDYTADRAMYGNQTVRVEHYEDSGLASVHFSFSPLGSTINGGGSGEWEANYYNNPDLANIPALVRREPSRSYPLDVDWGNGSPAPGVINDDNWSARWRGRFFFEAGDYVFQARSDDGVRVYIDGIRLIDAWYDGYKEPSNQFLAIGRGDHEITVEYYERGGAAFERVWWYRTATGGSGSGGDRDD